MPPHRQITSTGTNEIQMKCIPYICRPFGCWVSHANLIEKFLKVLELGVTWGQVAQIISQQFNDCKL